MSKRAQVFVTLTLMTVIAMVTTSGVHTEFAPTAHLSFAAR